MKFVSQTTSDDYKNTPNEINSLNVQQLNINLFAKLAKISKSKKTSQKAEDLGAFSKKESIFKNWTNQNFCIATS